MTDISVSVASTTSWLAHGNGAVADREVARRGGSVAQCFQHVVETFTQVEYVVVLTPALDDGMGQVARQPVQLRNDA
jgi:hypothetical protein